MISSTMAVTSSRRLPLIEAFAFPAFVAWFIWQLQDASPYSWILLPIWLIASFALNKDTPQSLGWRVDNFWSATKRASAVFIPCALAILVTGFLLDGVQHAFYQKSRNQNRERARSEEHTSELQSLAYLVCRLLLEKKKQNF